MRRFATGVTIITTRAPDGAVAGFTANAFASVTADPPMVLICVNRTASSHPIIAESRFFTVNVLALEQRTVAQRFASGEPSERFDGIAYELGATGAPVLTGSLAHFDCTLAEEHTAGTHTIFLGNVVACDSRDGAPLGYYDREYRDFRIDASETDA
jgi:flavin reductase (DIM6/NTAB) family NADH-FMN oxidoreductase RutF